VALGSAPCLAQDSSAPRPKDKPHRLQITPVLLQSSQSGANALGLDYSWKRSGSLESSQGNTLDFPDTLEGIPLGHAMWELDAQGSLTGSSSNASRPRQGLDATAAYELTSKPIYARVGLTGRLETTQDLDKRQSQFGLSGLLAKSNALTLGDTVSVLALYGTVQPDKDEERKTLLGQLSRYERWNLEATYSMPLMRASEAKDDPIWRKPRSLELGYRHWQEVDAPYALRSAGMDRQRLGYLRLKLDGDYFIQFSKGRQPFDQKSQRAIKLGWELKLSLSAPLGQKHRLSFTPCGPLEHHRRPTQTALSCMHPHL
jgi:hypothetical protein